MKNISIYFLLMIVSYVLIGAESTLAQAAKNPGDNVAAAISSAAVDILGNNGEGSSTDMISNSDGCYINATRFQAATSFSALRIKAKVLGITGKYKCAIYSDNAGSPQALLKESGEVTDPTTGWQTFTLTSSQSIVSGTYYWLAIWSNLFSIDAGIYCETTGDTTCWTDAIAYGAWPDPIITVGGSSYNYCIYAEGGSVDVAAMNDMTPPSTYELLQNYPNPFNPTTNIEYQIANSGFVSLKVFDVLGREAATLVNGQKSIGTYTVQWNASNLPSGVYFSRLTVQQQEGMPVVLTKKLLLAK